MTPRACPCCGVCSVLQLGLSLSTPRTTSMWELVGVSPLQVHLMGQSCVLCHFVLGTVWLGYWGFAGAGCECLQEVLHRVAVYMELGWLYFLMYCFVLACTCISLPAFCPTCFMACNHTFQSLVWLFSSSDAGLHAVAVQSKRFA